MKTDRITAAVFFLLGAVVLREGLAMPYMQGYSPGPGFFPIWMGVALMLISALLFLSTRRPNRPFIESSSGFRKLLMVFIAFVVYGFALDYLGLLVGLALLLAFLLGYVERSSWRSTVAVALLGSLGSYLIFEVWLGVQLPVGILGI